MSEQQFAVRSDDGTGKAHLLPAARGVDSVIHVARDLGEPLAVDCGAKVWWPEAVPADLPAPGDRCRRCAPHWPV